MENRSITNMRMARIARSVAVLVLGGMTLTSCGSSDRTVAVPTPTPINTIVPVGGQFAGVYNGTWTFTAGLEATAPTYGGPMTLTIDASGNVAAVFTDTLGAGGGTFSAAGVVDADGNIAYAQSSPPLLGAPSFGGGATQAEDGTRSASGTVYYDYPGKGSWSASGGLIAPTVVPRAIELSPRQAAPR